MSEFQPNQIDKLVNYLARSINWAKRSFFNLGSVFADKFATNKRPNGQRAILSGKALTIYDDYGNLLLYVSNDTNNKLVTSVATYDGLGIWTDLIRSVLTILSLSDRDAKITMQLRPTNNGQLLVTGVDAIATSLTLDKEQFEVQSDGMIMRLKDSFLTLDNAGIELEDTRRIGSSGTFLRFFDDGGSTKFHGFYVNGALLAQINANDLDLSGVALKLNNAPATITTETLTKYVTAKDSAGNTIKLGVVV